MNIGRACMIARDLMHYHGLKDWRFELHKQWNLIGACFKEQKVIRLSWPRVQAMPEEDVIEAILHEIAHGLAPRHGHNVDWAVVCAKIGGSPQNRYREETR